MEKNLTVFPNSAVQTFLSPVTSFWSPGCDGVELPEGSWWTDFRRTAAFRSSVCILLCRGVM